MKRIILLVSLFLCGVITAFSQDFGTQIPNSDFEAEWKTYSGNKTSGKEPYCWHAFHSAKGSKASLAEADHIAQDENVRPGSAGKYSVRIFPKEINLIIAKIIANGSLTNGRMNAGSTSAADDDNNIYTDRNTAEFNTPIDVVPDSVTAWFSFYSSGSGNYAAFHSAVHGDSDFILYGNGKASNAAQQFADANYEFTRTTSKSDSLGWQRITVPFKKTGTCTDEKKYVLVTMSTNRTPAKGNSSDRLYVDDIVLIYNPTLTTGTLAQTEYEGDANGTIDIQVPFTLVGSMSVSNLNKAANQVIAQLSDASGSFDNPIELGRVTTNTSGVVEGKIPASVVDGNYKVRVVSTNYPITAEPSASEITVKRYYEVSFAEYDSELISLTGAGKFYVVGDDHTVTVSANLLTKDYGFGFWSENESMVSSETSYTFTIDHSCVLSVVLMRQVQLTISASAGGSVSSEGGMYNTGVGLNVVATPNEGYKFVNWTENGKEVSTNPSYSFMVKDNADLVANFVKVINVSATINLAGSGAISGVGEYIVTEDSVEVKLVAVASNETYRFINWTVADSVVSENSTYTFKAASNVAIQANFVALVTLEAIATTGGTVTGAGIFEKGSNVSLFASANDKYRFDGWYAEDTLYSSTELISLVADSDMTFDARFIRQYTINAISNVEGLTVEGSGVYDAGATVNLIASDYEGYEFNNWRCGDVLENISIQKAYSFVAAGDYTYTASYTALKKYDVVAEADPTTGGSISGAGSYFENSEVTLTATPNAGYDFVNWTENDEVISEETSLTFVAAARSLVAHFKANFVGYTVNLITTEGGKVTGAGLYEEGTTITVEAMPAAKYSFVSWNDATGAVLSTLESYSFVLSQDVELYATFERVYEEYQIEISSIDETMGTVEGSAMYKEESEVTVKAIPSEGYRFLHWTENDEVVSNLAEYTFTCAGERNLVAEFKKVYVVTIADYTGAEIRGLGTGVFDENTSVTLAVSVDENHRFVSWLNAADSSVITTSTVLSFVATEDKNLIANIAEKGKPCTVSVQTGGSVSGLRNGQYEAGETITLVANPSEGYLFKGWSLNGEIIETATLLTMEVSDDMNINAVFVPVPQPVEVVVSVNDDAFGTVLGAGTYKEGDEVQLFATPAIGYEFVGWTKNGHMLSNLSTLYLTVVDDCTIEAEFKFIEKETTAVEDIAIECEIYPNPVSSLLNIVSDQEISSIKIVSLKGMVVYASSEHTQYATIDVASLQAGVYIVIATINGENIQKQIVVR
ncbi:MAG: InlB B-repeat-containing protein [Bacteroidales bacterium]|nr:InlB B-repeat-containing protein [Bacteroidales bacterium]